MNNDPKDLYPPEAFADMAALEPGHFWFEARNRLIAHLLHTHAPHARTWLEVGCGTGFVLQHLASTFPRLALSAVEYYPQALPFAQRRVPRADIRQGDARDLPWTDTFDAIGCFDVLEHIPEDTQALRAIHQALRPGGVFLLTVPQHPWLWSDADTQAHHQRRYTRAELLTKAADAGFLTRDLTSFVSLLLPLLLARKLRPDNPTQATTLAPELRPHPLVNTALRAALDLERAGHRAGLRYPLGGSLVAVLQRPA